MKKFLLTILLSLAFTFAGNLTVEGKLTEIPGKMPPNDLYNYVYVLKYKVTKVVEGNFSGKEILVGVYNPLIARGKVTGKTGNKSKPGEQGRSNGRVKELLGVEYKHLKGKEAIKKLLSERNGYVRNAYHNKQLGDIALVYGNEKLGLKHIIERRKKQGFNDEMIKSLLYNLDDVISSGKVSRSTKGRSTFEIYKDGNVAIISPTLNGANFKFMLTAYRTKKRK